MIFRGGRKTILSPRGPSSSQVALDRLGSSATFLVNAGLAGSTPRPAADVGQPSGRERARNEMLGTRSKELGTAEQEVRRPPVPGHP
jgi:hypothetical protein